MKERPILMSAPMVRAILNGEKTQTRRIVLKSGRDADYDYTFTDPVRNRAIFNANRPAKPRELLLPSFGVNCPYGVPGDRLWVKETWSVHRDYNALSPTKVNVAMGGDTWGCVNYVATPTEGDFWGKKRVSIHMPRWASRLTLEVTAIRVERLHAITLNDACAEGPPACDTERSFGDYIACYRALWESINGAGSWAKNPFVWVITFRRA